MKATNAKAMKVVSRLISDRGRGDVCLGKLTVLKRLKSFDKVDVI